MIDKEALKQIVGGEQICDRPEVLDGFAKDNSYVKPKKPALVVQPGDPDQILKIMKLAKKKKMKLIPVSSGAPRFRGDTVPLVDDAVIVDLSKMKKVMWISRRDRVALIEAGVTFGELEEQLEKEGLRSMMPLLPRKNKSIVGAYMERDPFTTARYAWDQGDPIASAELIFGTGKVMRTGGASGPAPTLEEQRKVLGAQKLPMSPFMMDARRIIQGSQGSLGICSWAALRCEVLPEYEKIYFAGSDNLDELVKFSNRLMYIRLIDELYIVNSLNFACLFEKDPAKIEALRSSLPEHILVTSISGYGTLPKEMIEYKDLDIQDEAKAAGVTVVDTIGGISEADYKAKVLRKACDEDYWKTRFKGDVREIFFLAPVRRVPEFVEAAKTMAKEAGFDPAAIGVYCQTVTQGVAAHIEFDLYMGAGEAEKNKAFYEALSRKVHEMGGFFSRPYDLWSDIVYAECETFVKYAKGLKEIFDPDLIMNPEKICFKEMGNES